MAENKEAVDMRALQDFEEALCFHYTNWRGETALRRAIPISIRHASTEWHPEKQWLLLAYDIDKQAEREFALADCSFGLSAAIAAARPHIMEEAARIAIGNMPDGPTGQETPYGQGRIDAAAAIRAAKETDK